MTAEKPAYTETHSKCLPAVEERAQEQGSSISSKSEQLQFSTKALPSKSAEPQGRTAVKPSLPVLPEQFMPVQGHRK